MAQPSNVVDLAFPLQGTTIPADHGYALYAALCRPLPWLHADPGVGVHPIHGRLVGRRAIELTPASRLTFRLPAERIPNALCLAGQQLDLAGSRARVGVPQVRALAPAPSLLSRIVVIAGFQEPSSFLTAVERQMAAAGPVGSAALVLRARARPAEGRLGGVGEYTRRTLVVAGRTIVGFAVIVTGLDAASSLSLQQSGIGGRRRFGCGIFVTTPRAGGR